MIKVFGNIRMNLKRDKTRSICKGLIINDNNFDEKKEESIGKLLFNERLHCWHGWIQITKMIGWYEWSEFFN